jgi:hypothetical protein
MNKSNETKKIERVSDILGGDFQVENVKPMEESLDKDYLIKDFAERDGEFGKYVIILCEEIDTHVEIGVRTGGKIVIEKLNKLKDKKSLPIIGMFKDKGKYYDMI